jgi:hypothetical protein
VSGYVPSVLFLRSLFLFLFLFLSFTDTSVSSVLSVHICLSFLLFFLGHFGLASAESNFSPPYVISPVSSGISICLILNLVSLSAFRGMPHLLVLCIAITVPKPALK